MATESPRAPSARCTSTPHVPAAAPLHYQFVDTIMVNAMGMAHADARSVTLPCTIGLSGAYPSAPPCPAPPGRGTAPHPSTPPPRRPGPAPWLMSHSTCVRCVRRRQLVSRLIGLTCLPSLQCLHPVAVWSRSPLPLPASRARCCCWESVPPRRVCRVPRLSARVSRLSGPRLFCSDAHRPVSRL